ncbi:TetR/AcrR family transcriptional regulator [Psychrobacter sp. H8-1]|uniref:TetR/AcrR family transcriptional regulator n=1 Tax=Psychrobacter sp. H8-1 TaxID=2774129 RepID=UPI001919FF32|nr:TetR/AcrR family transcriptional regulator [Psychrobacter sp. H8-1]
MSEQVNDNVDDKVDDKMEDILVDSELAKKLVPNKFKFTSQQGRARRQKLLMGAKKLSETKAINDITLADVCEEAGIPRASAYHFFPNIEAIFLALRFLNAIEILEILATVEIEDYDRWQGYLTAIIERSVGIFYDDSTKAKLIYDTNTPDFEGDSFGEDIDLQIVELVYERLTQRYELPNFGDVKDMLMVTFSIINGIFTLSYRRYEEITDKYLQEATIAAIAYLRCYLPENLPRKK